MRITIELTVEVDPYCESMVTERLREVAGEVVQELGTLVEFKVKATESSNGISDTGDQS